MNERHLTPLAFAAGALLTLSFAATPAAAQTITRVSLNWGGPQLVGISSSPSLSGNGRYIAFHYSKGSGADPLPGGLYRRDRVTGHLETLNVNNASPPNSTMDGYSPSISGDGRYVAFSTPEPMVTDDTNQEYDVFVRDVDGRTTTRVSVSSDGTQGNGRSDSLSISADGRYVAFDSTSSNLVLNDHNKTLDVFRHDRRTGTTERVSVRSDGTEGNGLSGVSSISGDGRYVAFESAASNLDSEEDENNARDIFVRDMLTETTVRVSVASDGTKGIGASTACSISADGRYVAFQSTAANLVSVDNNGKSDIFRHDLLTGETTLVSVAADGTQADADCLYPSISGGGRFIAFLSWANTLAPGGTANMPNIYVRDMVAGTLTRVSVSTTGPAIDGTTYATHPRMSADGRYVAFESLAPLVPDDTNNAQDVYMYGPLTTLTPAASLAAGAPVKSSPTAVDGVVYFGDNAGKLHAVNTTTGAEVSGFPVDIGAAVGATVQIGSRPAVYYSTAGKFIYLTTTRGDVCRVAMNGSSVLHYSDFLGSGNVSAPAVPGGGKVYVGLTTPTFSCVVKLNEDLSVNVISGGIAGAGSTISSLSVRGNKVYAGLTNGVAGDIVVLSTADLTPLSSGVAVGEGATSPPYVAGKYMYIGTLAGNFYRLNASNSGVDTSFGDNGKVAVGEPLPTSPFFNSGAFYAGTSQGKVWQIGEDGSLSVAYDTWNPSAVVGGVVVERGSNTLAFGTSAGDFYKVPLNGGDAGIFEPNLGFNTTPTYDASTGRFFIGSNDGDVYGF